MSLNVVIIGAVAAGPKAGCRIKRLLPEARVTMLDRDDIISYGGCGIPFYVSGDVPELKGLLSTSFHMVRDPAFFKGAKGIDVLTRTEALAVDRAAKTVLVKDLASGRESTLAYDKLVLATGSSPFLPPVEGVDLPGVLPVANAHHAEAIKGMVAGGEVGRAVIVGAGATGLEMAEALADLWGVEVDILEMADQVLPGVLDQEMARMLEYHLSQQEGLTLRLGVKLEKVLAGEDGRVAGVLAGGETYPADLVIMATGYRPNAELARAAGLELTAAGAVKVDAHMRTSDPDIYAGGDCVGLTHQLTGQEVYFPSGSLANRVGRVIGTNVCGGHDTFPGVLGSFCIKLFGLSVAATGLTEAAAAKEGLTVVAPLVVQADRAHFHPDMKLMYLKLVVEAGSRRVLGLTTLGENGDAVAGRVSAVAGLLAKAAVLEDVSNLEMPYSPPLGAAVDILNAAANTAENLLAGKLRPMTPEEFSHRLAARDAGNTVFLDVRAIDNASPYLKELAPAWQHLPQETLLTRVEEVPADKDVVLICNSGVRSYEAQVMLESRGIKNTYNLSGGVAAVKRWGESILAPKEE
ncbi:MAG: FAD-dependent oxidoreductase [Deltaproteobacteria bacterium]|nr:FAD-dependent oxidoreductase [Deltaproteobacteria bacterium]